MSVMLFLKNSTFNRIRSTSSLGSHFLCVDNSHNQMTIVTIKIAGLLLTNYV